MNKHPKIPPSNRIRLGRREITYLRGALPRSLGPGLVLVHNHVKCARWSGTRGFRAWTQKPDKKRLIICRCSWAGAKLPVKIHYRMKRSVPWRGLEFSCRTYASLRADRVLSCVHIEQEAQLRSASSRATQAA
jgi:hypothetical protein